MKLRLGQTVDATDGPFGTLGDIVVDPHSQTVTHLVVEPMNQHLQGRLVPIWMIASDRVTSDSVTSDRDTLSIQLDTRHAMQLQQAAASSYQYVTSPLDLGDEWDVGTEDIVQLPFREIDAGIWGGDGQALVRYDRIPRGDVEIRDRSRVISSDYYDVGHVVGVVVDDDAVVGIGVASGLPGRRHVTLVPIKQVEKVTSDRVFLNVDRQHVKELPVTDEFEASDRPSVIVSTRHRIESTAETVAESSHQLIDRAKAAVHRDRV